MVKDKLELQVSGVDSLDSKAGVIIGFNGVILSVVLNLYLRAILSLLIVGATAILISICVAIVAYKTEPFRRDPDPRSLREWYFDKPKIETLAILIDNLVASPSKRIEESFCEKVDALIGSFSISFLGLLLVTLSLLLKR